MSGDEGPGACVKMAERGRERGEGGPRRGRSLERWVARAQERERGSGRRGGRAGRGGAGNGEAARDPNKAQPSLRREWSPFPQFLSNPMI